MKKPDCDDQPVLHLFSNKEQQAAVPGKNHAKRPTKRKILFTKLVTGTSD